MTYNYDTRVYSYKNHQTRRCRLIVTRKQLSAPTLGLSWPASLYVTPAVNASPRRSGRVEEASALADRISKEIASRCKVRPSKVDGKIDSNGMPAQLPMLQRHLWTNIRRVFRLTANSVHHHGNRLPSCHAATVWVYFWMSSIPKPRYTSSYNRRAGLIAVSVFETWNASFL